MIDIRFLFENLFVNKYEIIYAKRFPNEILQLNVSKKDDFGKVLKYEFYFLNKILPKEQILAYKKNNNSVQQLFIGPTGQEAIDFTDATFFEKLETTINPGIYLDSKLASILEELGHNRLPLGWEGKPDDLLEEYSKDCLQFLLGGKGRRYGKDRAFESLPDGAVLGNDITILFDGKAYKNGYNPTSDDLKRFSSYVTDFNSRYQKYLGRGVFTFIVISGHFDVGDEALSDRSDEMYEMCQTSLTFMTTNVLASCVKTTLENARIMDAVKWRKVFAKPVVKLNALQHQISILKKDKIL